MKYGVKVGYSLLACEHEAAWVIPRSRTEAR